MIALIALVIVCIIMGLTLKRKVNLAITLFIVNGYLAYYVSKSFELNSYWGLAIGAASILIAFIISRFTN